MKLEDIGFYTLSDKRATTASETTQISRLEVILTDKCNFKCPYCRELKQELRGDMSLTQVKQLIDMKPKNIRFSGGEPTVYPWIKTSVQYAKRKGVERIAISTNGSTDITFYKDLIGLGVNDISVSLDACCSEKADKLAGRSGFFRKVTNNIEELSKLTYVTVGVVVTKETAYELRHVIDFAADLGVSDIRVITAAQDDGIKLLIKQSYLDKFPILKYRQNNNSLGKNMRGITELDSRRCGLVLDDLAVAGKYHYPCIIYLREQGEPIGELSGNIRQDRKLWYEKHNSFNDSICHKNCLDVCIDYNNKFQEKVINQTSLPNIDNSAFTWNRWRNHSIADLAIACRFKQITSTRGRNILNNKALGWCNGTSLLCRPKEKHKAVMFWLNDMRFWFHMRSNEFVEVFKD